MKAIAHFLALVVVLGACAGPDSADGPVPDDAAADPATETPAPAESPAPPSASAADILFPRCDQLRSPIFIGCRLPGHPLWRN